MERCPQLRPFNCIKSLESKMTWFILHLYFLLSVVSIGPTKSHRLEENMQKRDDIINVKVTIPRRMVGHSRHKCAIRTTKGNADNRCCVFPFKYSDVTYYTCTYVNHKKPWCAVTKDYDHDGVWGECPESVRELKHYHKQHHQNQSHAPNDQILWNVTQNVTNETTEAYVSPAITPEQDDEAASELSPLLDSASPGTPVAAAASSSAVAPSSSSNSTTPSLSSTPVAPNTTPAASIASPNATTNATIAGPSKTSVQPNNTSAIPPSRPVIVRSKTAGESGIVAAQTVVGPGGGQTTITTTCKTVVTQTVIQGGQTCPPTLPGTQKPGLPLPPYLRPGAAGIPTTATTAAQPGLKVITEDIGCNGRKVVTEETWRGTGVVPASQIVVENSVEIITNGKAGICKIILPSGKTVEIKPAASASGLLSTASQTILTGVTKAGNQTRQTPVVLPSPSRPAILSTANSNPTTTVPNTTAAGQVQPSKRAQ